MNAETASAGVATPPTELDPRWCALVARDPEADGTFYYSVATTGVYCFPSCRARLANPKNVRFHRTREDAERAGFRPCKRCKPDRERRAREISPATIELTIAQSSIGFVLVARSAAADAGVNAVLLGDDPEALRRDLQHRFPGATLIEGGVALDALTATVIRCIEAPARGLDVPLDMRGTEFQQSVWRALRAIPTGRTASYSQIAGQLGMPNAARAVAQACAANPLAVLVPCHRVVRSDGELSGYRWGVERKRALLEREASV